MNVLRWFLVPPATMLAWLALLYGIDSLGQSYLGQWMVTCGLVCYFSGAFAVMGASQAGQFVCPVVDIKAQRAFLLPLYLLVIICIILTFDTFDRGRIDGDFTRLGLKFLSKNPDGSSPYPLQPGWRIAIFTVGMVSALADRWTNLN